MKELILFFQKAKIASLEQIRFFVFCSLVFSLPYDRIYSQLLIIILLVLVLIDFKLSMIKAIPKKFWLFQAIFILTVIGLLNTSSGDGMKEGLFLVEKQLAIILLPFLLPMSFTIDKRRIKVVLKTFTASVTISIVYLMISQAFTFLELGLTVKQYINSGLLFNHLFSEPLNMHASYLSMYVTLAIIFILHELITKENQRKKELYVQLSILLIGILFLASRSNLLVLIFISFFVYPFLIKKKIRTKLITSFLILITSASILYLSPYLRNRFSSELVGDVTAKQIDNEPRVVRWKEAVSLIKESPVIGYGSGSEVIKLRQKYWKKGLINSYHQKYNAHNQYLSILIKHGIIGFTLFLFVFVYYFKISIRKKSFLYFSFLIQVSVIFMVENVLDMNKGIFYFAIFNTLFGYFYITKVNEDESASIGNNSVV